MARGGAVTVRDASDSPRWPRLLDATWCGGRVGIAIRGTAAPPPSSFGILSRGPPSPLPPFSLSLPLAPARSPLPASVLPAAPIVPREAASIPNGFVSSGIDMADVIASTLVAGCFFNCPTAKAGGDAAGGEGPLSVLALSPEMAGVKRICTRAAPACLALVLTAEILTLTRCGCCGACRCRNLLPSQRGSQRGHPRLRASRRCPRRPLYPSVAGSLQDASALRRPRAS